MPLVQYIPQNRRYSRTYPSGAFQNTVPFFGSIPSRTNQSTSTMSRKPHLTLSTRVSIQYIRVLTIDFLQGVMQTIS